MKKICGLFVVIGFLLSGCGDNVVSKLKKSTIENFPAYTYEQILDNRVLCASIEWIESEKNNGVTEITYRCILKKPNNKQAEYDEKIFTDIYEQNYPRYLKRGKEIRENEIKKMNEMLGKIDTSISLINTFINKNASLFDSSLLQDSTYHTGSYIHSPLNDNLEFWRQVEKVLTDTDRKHYGFFPYALESFNYFKGAHDYSSVIMKKPELIEIEKLINQQEYDSIIKLLALDKEKYNGNESFESVMKRLLRAGGYQITSCIGKKMNDHAYDKENPEVKLAQEQCIESYLDDLKAFNQKINQLEPKIRKMYHEYFENKVLKNLSKAQEDIKRRLIDFESKNSDDLLQEKAHNQALANQNAYKNSHVKDRIEEIVWVYNKETETFYLQKEQLYFILGNDKRDIRNLYFSVVVAASTNDAINTVDKYFELRRNKSAQDFYNAIYKR